MDNKDTTKGTISKAKTKTKKVPTPQVGPVTATKTVQNVSLQSWAVPNGNGTVTLVPGATITIPASAVTNRLINLYKRRLISIR